MVTKEQKLFTESLRTLVEEARGAAVEVCRALKISEPSMSNYLAGKQMPGRARLVKMAEYFGVSVDKLLGLKL